MLRYCPLLRGAPVTKRPEQRRIFPGKHISLSRIGRVRRPHHLEQFCQGAGVDATALTRASGHSLGHLRAFHGIHCPQRLQ